MARYFKDVETLEQLRKQYKDLLKKHHSDNGGNLSDMQEINSEYDKLFKLLKDKHKSKATDNKENNAKTDFYNMKYDFSEDTKLKEVLQQIVLLTFCEAHRDVLGLFENISVIHC